MAGDHRVLVHRGWLLERGRGVTVSSYRGVHVPTSLDRGAGYGVDDILEPDAGPDARYARYPRRAS
jgi:hypothetical protein